AGGAVAASLAGCTRRSVGPAVHTGRRRRWRLVSSFPRSLDTIFGAAEHFAKRLGELTAGRFEVRVHAPGEVVPALKVLDAVGQGTAELGHSASYYYMGKQPALAFDTTVPFGLGAREQLAWLEHGGGDELLAPLFAELGVVRLFGGNTGVQMGGWFRRRVERPEDLRGLKMRIPGMGGKVMSRLGVTVQVLPGGDIYPALERGAIDATEWVGPYDDEKLGFHQVARYYYYPGWWEPGPSLAFYVHRKGWEGLSAEERTALQLAAREAGLSMVAAYDARNPAALQRLLDKGVQLERFSDAILAAAERATEALHTEIAAKDRSYRRVLERWRAFRDASRRWFSTAELAYARWAYRAR
ncbi:MAG: ABC transporter substrate-binding protein, partial [Planctomycetota bacterium]